MEYGRLGKSDLTVSRIGFGCMALKPGAAGTETVLHAALAAGMTFFDTADLYDKGANEELVGKALKGKRNGVLLATKAGNQWRTDGSGWDWNPRKEYILSAAEASLQRLQTDYIDLYQLHGGTVNDPVDETIEAFELLKQQGKIRHYGISSIRPNVIRNWMEKSGMISVMVQYGLLDRRPEEEALSLLQRNNVGVLARGGLAQGLLAGKPPKPYLGYTADDVQKASAAVASLTTAKRNAAQTALQFVLRQPSVACAVVGMRTTEQLNDAVAAAGAALSEEEYKRLANLLPRNVYQEHR